MKSGMSRNRHSDTTYPKMKNEQFCSLRVGRLISCAENKVQYFQVDRHVALVARSMRCSQKGYFLREEALGQHGPCNFFLIRGFRLNQPLYKVSISISDGSSYSRRGIRRFYAFRKSRKYWRPKRFRSRSMNKATRLNNSIQSKLREILIIYK